MTDDTQAITVLLSSWRQGDQAALDELVPMVYDQLRALAGTRMKSERSDHTLSATALVHEAYGRLVEAEISWRDRVHFFAVASRVMRRILVDHARGKSRLKRGGEYLQVTLDELNHDLGSAAADQVVALDEALKKLSEVDPTRAQALEMHYFAGLSYEECAEVLGVSRSTLQRQIRLAKAWLRREMQVQDS